MNGTKRKFYKKKRLWIPLLLLLLLGLAATPFLLNPLGSFHKTVVFLLKLGGVRERVVRTQRTQIHYWEGGVGKERTVLLLHGMGGNALMTWMRIMPALAKRYHVLAPDLLASNFLGLNPKTYSIDKEVALTLGLLDALKVQKTDIVGLSVGGWVALLIASEHPERVGKMILVESAGLTTKIPELAKLTLDDRAKARRFLRLLFYYPPPLPGFVLDQLVQVSQHIKPQYLAVFQGFVQNSKDRVLDGKLKDITQETLVIQGRNDTVIPLEVGQKLAAGLPNAELIILEKSGHAPVWDSPRQLKRDILEFLARP